MRRSLIVFVLVVVVLFGVLYAVQVWPGSPLLAAAGASIAVALAAWAIRLLMTSVRR
jgi:hypothetical protein